MQLQQKLWNHSAREAGENVKIEGEKLADDLSDN
jgi:hypothetical protein